MSPFVLFQLYLLGNTAHQFIGVMLLGFVLSVCILNVHCILLCLAIDQIM